MCGIVACIGEDAQDLAVRGLQRMQYRGYDSYGFAWVDDPGRHIQLRKSIDSLDNLQDRLPVCTAILGHTRWATHGGVSLENCHPHVSQTREFSLAHNGIVENHQRLKVLTGNVVYLSQTDTEVIVRLLESALRKNPSRLDALRSVISQLDGRNTIVVLFSDGELLGVRQGSPLVVGKASGQYFLASDVLSFSQQSRECFALDEGCIVRIKGQELEVFAEHGGVHHVVWEQLDLAESEFSKDGYAHYMLKEIMEQWQSVASQANLNEAEFGRLAELVRSGKSILVTGAGGAYFTSIQVAWLLREIAGVRALAVAAYEVDSMSALFEPGDLVLAISQSGETADTIQAIETARSWGMQVASLVNMPMSSIARLSDIQFSNQSGPEICVLSTKSASAQVTFGYLLAKRVAGETGSREKIGELSQVLSQYLTLGNGRGIQQIARSLLKADGIFVLGRGLHLGTARIAALNIKEASYFHAEAFSAGELKHGVIALIEKETPVIMFVPRNDVYMLNVAAEVRARGASVIGIGYEDNSLFDEFIALPEVSDPQLAAVSSIIPCQLLAYYLSTQSGINPDKPRNLAKSVTVQ
jgi:glucosamine--fructose-6-phosphate aminotransferase (isomerizing)